MTEKQYPELHQTIRDSLKDCALGDSAYAAGMLLGWNLCTDGRDEDFRRIREDRLRAAASASKEAQEAAPQPQEAAPSEPAAVAGPSDESEALDLLEILFDAWENGTPCYEDPETYEGFIGHAFRLDDTTFHRCCNLLNRRRSKHATQPSMQHATFGHATQPQNAAPSQDAEDAAHIANLIEVARMPNAEYVADAHNDAVKHLRARAQQEKK